MLFGYEYNHDVRVVALTSVALVRRSVVSARSLLELRNRVPSEWDYTLAVTTGFALLLFQAKLRCHYCATCGLCHSHATIHGDR